MDNILLVERDSFFADIFSSLLEFYDLEFVKCTNPELIPDFFERALYKVILVNFKDSNDDIVFNLNKIVNYKPKIVILHNYYDKALEEELFFDYVYAYLIKPKGIIHLKDILYTLFDKKIAARRKKKIVNKVKRVANY